MLPRRAFLRIFLLLYAASGAAALIYEVAWTRLLTLQMGHTVAAASTVLAAFMGGLAAGAWVAGRLNVDTPAARLRWYAALEIAIATIAIVLPFLFATFVPPLRWAYADGAAPFRFGLVRLVLSLLLIGSPAAAMGATFPIAAEWFASAGRLKANTTYAVPKPTVVSGFSRTDSAADVGVLYAANTAGAALGAIAAGFGLIPTLGIRGATLIGVALNAIAAAGALWIAAAASASSLPPLPLRSLPPPRAPSPPHPVLAAVAAAISGFAALVYEVAWTRLLALVIGPTTYAFATMAASFITGLALGAAGGSRLARRSTRPEFWLGLMLVVTAVAASTASWFATSRLPFIVASTVADPNVSFAAVICRQTIEVVLLLLPTTVALGAAFPLAVASTGAGAVARDTALVYASNTVGAICGALAAGFLLLPAVGLQTTFRIAALVGIAAGAGVWMATAGRKLIVAMSIAIAAGIVIFALPQWDRELLASGAYKYAPYLRTADLRTALRAGRLEYYKDGAAATVSVRRLAGTLSLSIDGKVDASNGGDMLTQRLLGLLPVLMHDAPANVCVIGLGSGVTLESAIATGTVKRADVVEISPEVVEASQSFARENANVLGADNVHLIVGDGRSHLLLTNRQYDVIISEPSNPWMAGVAALFTREFFEAARRRLAPDGLLCQWAHTYDISPEDLRSVVRTFHSVFPHATMWLVGAGDLLLIGTNGPAIEPHIAGIGPHLRLGSASAMLADVSDSRVIAPGFQVLSLYAGGPAELANYADEAAIQTDDRMALEFSAPRGIYGRSGQDNSAEIRALANGATKPAPVSAVVDTATGVSWTARGLMDLKAEAFEVAYTNLRRAVEMTRDSPVALAAALRGVSDAAAGAGRQDEELAWLRSLAAEQPSNAALRIELSRVLAAGGRFNDAVAAAQEAMRLTPDDPASAEQLAAVLADAGDADQLERLADAMLAKFPRRDEARYFRASALFLKGRVAEAEEEARRFVAVHPTDARGQGLLGAACGTLGKRDCAEAAFTAALRANPRDPSAYVNLGVFRLQAADPADAAEYFSEALTLDPDSKPARDGLAQARAALGKP